MYIVWIHVCLSDCLSIENTINIESNELGNTSLYISDIYWKKSVHKQRSYVLKSILMSVYKALNSITTNRKPEHGNRLEGGKFDQNMSEITYLILKQFLLLKIIINIESNELGNLCRVYLLNKIGLKTKKLWPRKYFIIGCPSLK